MPQIKLVLVQIRQPQNWTGSHVLTPNGILQFLSSDGATHQLVTKGGTNITHTGPLYQMVGYDPSAEDEEDYFRPIAIDQWSLLTKYCKRSSASGNLLPNLSYGGALYDIKWQNATWTDNGYSIFSRVNLT